MEGLKKAIFDIMGGLPIKQGFIEESEIPKCDVCGEPKLSVIQFPNGPRIMHSSCLCDKKRQEIIEAKEQEEWRKKDIENKRTYAIPDAANRANTFDKDNGSNPKITDVCRRYVDNWKQMKSDNIGILFYGNVGAGKTFLASCIANALVDIGVSVHMTTFPRIINQIQSSFEGRDDYLRDINEKSLLIIDDLGVERDTAYAMEQVFNVIDSRLRSNRPLIITTNLSMSDLKNPTTVAFGRIYDRVLEMCSIPLKLEGVSKRVENANEKRNAARRILGLESEQEKHKEAAT